MRGDLRHTRDGLHGREAGVTAGHPGRPERKTTMKRQERTLWLLGTSILLAFAMLIGATFIWYSGTVYHKENKVKAENLSIAAYAYESGEDGKVLLASQRDLSVDKTPLIQAEAWSAGARCAKFVEVRNRGGAAVQISLRFTVTDNSAINSLWYRFCRMDASWNEIGGQEEPRPMNTLEALGDMYAFPLESGGVLRFKLEYGLNSGTKEAAIRFEADAVIAASLFGGEDKVVDVYDAVDFQVREACASFRLMRNIRGNVTLTQLAGVDFNGYTLQGDLSLGTAEAPILTAGSAAIGSEAGGGLTGRLSLFTPNADIYQYGTVGSVYLGAMANQSLYMHGTVKSTVEVIQGRLVLEKGAIIPAVEVPGWIQTVVHIDNDGVIERLDAPVTNRAFRPVVKGNAVQSVTENTSADLTDATRWDGKQQKEPVSSSGVYQVGEAAELAFLAAEVNRGALPRVSIRLTADIDLNHREWTPIGTAVPFSGELDGQGHTVRNLQIFEGAQGSGLFGTVSGAVIRNLVVDTVHLKDVGSNSGALLGRSLGCTLENCRVRNAVVAADSGAASVGGLAGRVESGAFGAANCTVADTRVSGYFSLGGLVGYCEASAMTHAVIAGCAVERVTVAAVPYKGEHTAWSGKHIQTHAFIGMARADAGGASILLRGCAIRESSHNGDADTMLGGEAVNAWIARGNGRIDIE